MESLSSLGVSKTSGSFSDNSPSTRLPFVIHLSFFLPRLVVQELESQWQANGTHIEDQRTSIPDQRWVCKEGKERTKASWEGANILGNSLLMNSLLFAVSCDEQVSHHLSLQETTSTATQRESIMEVWNWVHDYKSHWLNHTLKNICFITLLFCGHVSTKKDG